MPINCISRCWNTFYTFDMDVKCTPWWFGASTMTLQHHLCLAIPQLPKNLLIAEQSQQCREPSICPPMAYQDAETLSIHLMWMWNALQVGLVPQPWHFNIIRAWPYPNLPKIHHRSAQVRQCKGAPICSSMAYQDAETLSIHLMWMWEALHGGLGPQPWHYNIICAWSYPHHQKINP